MGSTPGIVDNSNATAITIDSSENVGIGTGSPIAKIDILGTNYVVTNSGQARGGIHIQPVSGAGAGEFGGAISFSTGGSGSSAIAAVNTGGSDTDSNGLAFFTHPSGTGSADAVESMRITEAGNLGIGTSSTYNMRATIAGAGAAVSTGSGSYAVASIYDTATAAAGTGGGLAFQGDDGTNSAVTFGAINGSKENATGGNYASYLGFSTRANSAHLSEKMRIDSSGYVGIGTSNPTNKFVVAEGTNQHGIELVPGSLSYIQAYDRATSDYGNLRIDAQTIALGTDDGTKACEWDSDGLQISNQVLADGRRRGMYGIYSPIKLAHMWGMGTTYKIAADGSTGGNLYGLCYSYEPNYETTGTNPGARNGLGHQMQWRAGGTTQTAIGTGIYTIATVTANSDARLKTDIETIPNAMSKVSALTGITYKRTDLSEVDPATGFQYDVRHTGVLAQDLLAVLPEAVEGAINGQQPEDGSYLSVAYGNMAGLFVEALKEQQATIEALTQRIETLENN